MSNTDSTALVGPALASIKGTFTIAQSSTAGTKNAISFIPDPTQPNLTEDYFQPPITEGNFVYKLYSTTTPTYDGFVTARKNAVDLPIYYGPLSQTIPGSNVHIQLFSNHTIFLSPLDKLYLYVVQDVAGSTTADTTENVQMGYVRVPAGWKQKVTIPDF